MMRQKWIWTLAVAALFCSCSVSEDLEMEVPLADDCILEVAVGLGDGGKTRGLSGDASSITATWQAGDKVLVYKDNTKVGELTPVSTGSASTTLRGQLSGTYAGSTLTLYYNTTSTSFSSFTQDGTLATILANLRYQSATTTVSKASDRPALTGTAVTFNLAANNPSINHFTLSKEMKTLRVCVKGSSTILVSATAASPTTDFYVAIPAAASKTYYIEGVDSRQSEYFQAKTAALSANKYYSANITLAEYPLTFEPVSATTTVTIPNSDNLTYEYSLNDGASWTSSSAAPVAMSVSAGQRLMVRRLTGNYPNYNDIGTITISQPCYVYGNVHSLLGFRNKLSGSGFSYRRLFLDQENLISHGYRNICIVPILDGLDAADAMFYSMFSGCSNLTTPPVLDFSSFDTSQVLELSNMFSYMFSGCSRLTTPPVLDFSMFDTRQLYATNFMFSYMFSDCSRLTTSPVLNLSMFNTTELIDMNGMFNSMFSGCSSLTTVPVLDLPIVATGQEVYMVNMFRSMFSGCSSLTTVPVLDLSMFDTVKDVNYNNMFASMFYGCSNLNAVKMKLTNTTILGDTSRFTDFLKNAKATGTLTVSSGTTSYWNAIKTAGYIPSGWSITEQ